MISIVLKLHAVCKHITDWMFHVTCFFYFFELWSKNSSCMKFIRNHRNNVMMGSCGPQQPFYSSLYELHTLTCLVLSMGLKVQTYWKCLQKMTFLKWNLCFENLYSFTYSFIFVSQKTNSSQSPRRETSDNEEQIQNTIKQFCC